MNDHDGQSYNLPTMCISQCDELRRGDDIHFAGLKGLNKPAVFVFPRLVVCLECGLAQFKLEGQQVELLREKVVSERITL